MNLETQEVEANIRLGDGVHGSADFAEIALVEKLCLEDPWVNREIEKLKLPEGTIVVCDPWMYGMSHNRVHYGSVCRGIYCLTLLH